MEDGDTPEDLQAEVAQLREQVRREQLGRILDGLGAPTAFADVYRGDLTPEAVKTFVEGLQMTPRAPSEPKPPAPAADAWGRYEDTSRGGPPVSTTEYDRLLAETREALDAVRNSRYAPPAEADDKFAGTIDKVNKLNRQWEREIRAGRAQPAYVGNTGFGGRLDPPEYAYRALDKVE